MKRKKKKVLFSLAHNYFVLTDEFLSTTTKQNQPILASLSNRGLQPLSRNGIQENNNIENTIHLKVGRSSREQQQQQVVLAQDLNPLEVPWGACMSRGNCECNASVCVCVYVHVTCVNCAVKCGIW